MTIVYGHFASSARLSFDYNFHLDDIYVKGEKRVAFLLRV